MLDNTNSESDSRINVGGTSRRTYVKSVGAVVVGAAGLAGCLGGGSGGGGGGGHELTMSSFATGTGWYVLAGAISDNVKQHLPDGSSIDVQPIGGGIGVIELLRGGRVDFGLGMPQVGKWALNSNVAFNKSFEDLQGIIGHLDTYWVVIMLLDKVPVDTFADVREQKYGLNIALGPAGGAGPIGVEQSFESNGITFDDLKSWGGSTKRMDFGDMPSAIQGGDVEAIAHVGSPGHPTWTKVGQNHDIKLLEQTKKGKEQMAEYGWIDVGAVPKGTYNIDRDVEAMGYRTSVQTTADLPDEVARSLVKGIIEEQQAIQEAYSAAEVFDPKLAGTEKFNQIPLHPAAEKYLQEEGYL